MENAALFCAGLLRRRPAGGLRGRRRAARLRRLRPESRPGALGRGTSSAAMRFLHCVSYFLPRTFLKKRHQISFKILNELRRYSKVPLTICGCKTRILLEQLIINSFIF